MLAGLPIDGPGPVAIFMTLTLFGGALAGVASYLLIEKPLLDVMRGKRRVHLPKLIGPRAAAGGNVVR